MSGKGFEVGSKGDVERRKQPEIEVDHPKHYGGDDDPFEAIKVMEAWAEAGNWDHVQTTNLTQTLKYIRRHGLKLVGSTAAKDLEKARWHLDRVIAHLKAKEKP